MAFQQNQRNEVRDLGGVAGALAENPGAKQRNYLADGYRVRKLTVTEQERLQALPDGWTLPGSDARRISAIGDAVTANVAQWIGERIIRADEKEARRWTRSS